MDNITVVLHEDYLIERIIDFITDCDADDLSTLVGEIFGGECFYDGDLNYSFTPDERYCGAFNDKIEKLKNNGSE